MGVLGLNGAHEIMCGCLHVLWLCLEGRRCTTSTPFELSPTASQSAATSLSIHRPSVVASEAFLQDCFSHLARSMQQAAGLSLSCAHPLLEEVFSTRSWIST